MMAERRFDERAGERAGDLAAIRAVAGPGTMEDPTTSPKVRLKTLRARAAAKADRGSGRTDESLEAAAHPSESRVAQWREEARQQEEDARQREAKAAERARAEAAASRVQAGVRGRLARQHSRALMARRQEDRDRENAAVRVQAGVRGLLGRKEGRTRANSKRFDETAGARRLALGGIPAGRSLDAESVPMSPMARERAVPASPGARAQSPTAGAAAAALGQHPAGSRTSEHAPLVRRPSEAVIGRWRLQAERARIASRRVAEAMAHEARARQEAEAMRSVQADEDASEAERARLLSAKVAADVKAAVLAKQLAAAGRIARVEAARMQRLQRERQARDSRRALEAAVMGPPSDASERGEGTSAGSAGRPAPAGGRHANGESSHDEEDDGEEEVAEPWDGEASPFVATSASFREGADAAAVAAVAALHAAEATGDDEGATLARAEMAGDAAGMQAAAAATLIQAAVRGHVARARVGDPSDGVDDASVEATRPEPAADGLDRARPGSDGGPADDHASSVGVGSARSGSEAGGVDLEGERAVHEERMAALEDAEERRRAQKEMEASAVVEAARIAARAEAEAATEGAKAAEAAAKAARQAAEESDAKRRAAEEEFGRLRAEATAEARAAAEEAKDARAAAKREREERQAAEDEARSLRAKLQQAEAVAEGERLRSEARADSEREAAARALETARAAEEARERAEAAAAKERGDSEALKHATAAEVERHRSLALQADEERARALKEHEGHVREVQAEMRRQAAEQEAALQGTAEAHRRAMEEADRRAVEAQRAADAERQQERTEAEAKRLAEREALLAQSDEHRRAMEAAFAESQARAEVAKEEMRSKREEAEERAREIRRDADEEKERLQAETRAELRRISSAADKAVGEADAAREEAERELEAARVSQAMVLAEVRETRGGYEMAARERARAREATDALLAAEARMALLERELGHARAAIEGRAPMPALTDSARPALLTDVARGPGRGAITLTRSAPPPPLQSGGPRAGRGAAFGVASPSPSVYALPAGVHTPGAFASPPPPPQDSPRALADRGSESESASPGGGGRSGRSRSPPSAMSRGPRRSGSRPNVRVQVPGTPVGRSSAAGMESPPADGDGMGRSRSPARDGTPASSEEDESFRRAVESATRDAVARLEQQGQLPQSTTEADRAELVRAAVRGTGSAARRSDSPRSLQRSIEAAVASRRPSSPTMAAAADAAQAKSKAALEGRGRSASPLAKSPTQDGDTKAGAPKAGSSSLAGMAFAVVRARRASQRAKARLNSQELRRPSVYDNRPSPRSKGEEDERKAELRVSTPWLVAGSAGSRLSTGKPMTSHLSSLSESSPADMAEREARRQANIDAAEARLARKRQSVASVRALGVKEAVKAAVAEGHVVAAIATDAREAAGLYAGTPRALPAVAESAEYEPSVASRTERGGGGAPPPPPPPPPGAPRRDAGTPRSSRPAGRPPQPEDPRRPPPIQRAPSDTPSAPGSPRAPPYTPRTAASVARRAEDAALALQVTSPTAAQATGQGRARNRRFTTAVTATIAARRFADSRRRDRQSVAGSFNRSSGGRGYSALAEELSREDREERERRALAATAGTSSPGTPRTRAAAGRRGARPSSVASRGSMLFDEVLSGGGRSPVPDDSARLAQELAQVRRELEAAKAGRSPVSPAEPSRAHGRPPSVASELTAGPVHSYTDEDAPRRPAQGGRGRRTREAAPEEDSSGLAELEAAIRAGAEEHGDIADEDLGDAERMIAEIAMLEQLAAAGGSGRGRRG